jgi:uncharacterized repeat protein (TIGR01451 family)
MRNFNPNQSLRKGWRAIAALGALVAMAGAAYADGTDAGTSVENTFVLNYEVEGVVQPPITNDTDPTTQPPGAIVQGTPTLFTVDRLVDLTVAAVNSPLSVTPGASGPNATLVFEVTNTGNDTQSYTFSLQDGVDSNGAADNFDATGVTISYQIDDDGTPGFGPGDTVVTVPAVTPGTANATAAQRTPDIPADTTFRVLVSGTIPSGQTDGTADDLILIAETRDPVDWVIEGASGSSGDVTAAETGANNLENVAQNVLADGFGTAEEIDDDGLFSAQGTFVVASPDLNASKTVAVIASEGEAPFDCAAGAAITSPAQFSIPGACIEYVITVVNNGATAIASNVDVLDILPDEIVFVDAAFAGFETAPVPSLAAPGPNTACDGTATTCSVEVSGGSIAPGNTATLTIRAIVD